MRDFGPSLVPYERPVAEEPDLFFRDTLANILAKLRREEKRVNDNGVPIPPTPTQVLRARAQMRERYAGRESVLPLVEEAFELLLTGVPVEDVPLRMRLGRWSLRPSAALAAHGFCRDHLNGFKCLGPSERRLMWKLRPLNATSLWRVPCSAT